MMHDIQKHALAEYPRECCGLIVIVRGKERYIPCRNIADGNHEFMIEPEDYANAEDMGQIVKIVHSHCNVSPKPSEADLIGCEQSGLPWLIISVPSLLTYELKPKGYKTPLLGRKFHHGVLDCYTFIRDYYDQVLGVKLPDFKRSLNWHQGGENLYIDGYEKAGFRRVDDLQEHDVILMRVVSPVPNHGAVYVGDNKIQHHQVDRLSSCDIYGGLYRKITVMTLRHKELMSSKQ